jgi:hypothetical protein
LQYVPANTATPEGYVYPEDRVFVDAQSWWLDTDLPFPGKHIHLGTYFPLLQEITGNYLHLDFLGKLHYDPGLATGLRVQIWDEVDPAIKIPLKFRCQDGHTQELSDVGCDYTLAKDSDGVWFHVDVPLTGVKTSGRKEFRCTLNVPKTPAGVSQGNRTYNTSRYHPIIQNGKPKKDYASIDRFGAAGWYTGAGYSNIYLNHDDGMKLFFGPPVKPGFQFRVKGEFAKLFVGIDTKPHTTDRGVVIYDGPGNNKWVTLQMPPSLAPGNHELYLATSKDQASPKGTASGRWKVPFAA